ncbi:bifunctional serine/threonine-protein kinase/formylglycine-generating enzyme family protein [Candidatus Magnetaquicoccus inordinatus]|uniref:bifunctional serine/threonine-protein kinase/formylglycine-generating enzyme family protein n=1 Tax=Candidatus Magnetaquicoccus inordinatus TaxID=2496818 RepID=UPI00102BC56B|nr:bifunctional serine/threonine-protein kinase/formylglycine-generating enzyme family protein [Candidatus Magnetaquicoccus inordinatus]
MGDTSADRYIDLVKLGQGGYGTVFKATDTIENRIVALKVLNRNHPELREEDNWRKQVDLLAKEVKRVEELSHDTICKINGLVEWQDSYAIVMQYIEGQSLTKWIEANQYEVALTRQERIRILLHLAGGISYASAKGFIHRDLKPDNILLKRGNPERPYILDFGISLSQEEYEEGDVQIAGTRSYMAPEAESGAKPSYLLDIYSFGMIAYEVLSGAMRKRVRGRAVAPNFEHEELRDYNPFLRELLPLMVHYDPAQRPSWAEIIDILSLDSEQWWSPYDPWWTDKAEVSTWHVAKGANRIERVQWYKGEPCAQTNGQINLWVQQIKKLHLRQVDNTISLRQRLGRAVVISELLSVERNNEGKSPAETTLCYWLLNNRREPVLTAEVRWHIFTHLLQIVLDIHHAGGYLGGIRCQQVELLPTRGGDHPEIRINFLLPERKLLRQAPKEETELLAYWQKRDWQSLFPLVSELLTGVTKFPSGWLELENRDYSPAEIKEWRKEFDRYQSYAKGIHSNFRLSPALFVHLFNLMIGNIQRKEMEDLVQKVQLLPKERAQIASTIEQKLIHVPRGKYYVGYGNNEPLGNSIAFFPIEVEAFYMMQQPVSQWEFRQYLYATGQDPRKFSERMQYCELDAHPMVHVTWEQAMAYANWVKFKGRSGQLPNELQWEIAANGGTKERKIPAYPWGNEHVTSARANISNQWLTTTPVASFPKTGLGFYDLCGNVWEWCQDSWSSDWNSQLMDARAHVVQKPMEWQNIERVVRGGAFDSAPNTGRCGYRNRLQSNLGYANVGFRVVFTE